MGERQKNTPQSNLGSAKTGSLVFEKCARVAMAGEPSALSGVAIRSDASTNAGNCCNSLL